MTAKTTWEEFTINGLKKNTWYVIGFGGSSTYVHSAAFTAASSSTSHTLSSAVSPSGKATVTLGATSVAEGSTTTATYSSIDDAYEFDYWSISGTSASLSSTTANPTTITMGTADATVTANLKEKSSSCTAPTASWATAPANLTVGGADGSASITTNYATGVIWSSSNTNVATISGNGTASATIHPLAAGATTITATVTGDGTTYCTGPATVDQNITVSAALTPTECSNSGHIFAYNDADRIKNGVRMNPLGNAIVAGAETAISGNLPNINVAGVSSVTLTSCYSEDKSSFPYMASYIKAKTSGSSITITLATGYTGTLTIYFGAYSSSKTSKVTNAANSATATSDGRSAETENNYTSKTLALVSGANTLTFGSNNAYISHMDIATVAPSSTHTITFHKNDGVSPETTTTQIVNHNESTALTSISTIGWTRSGYNFAGWAETADGAKAYDDGGNITLTADKDLYAQWTQDVISLPGTLLPADASLSTNASIDANGGILFVDATADQEWATWNVSFAQAGTYTVSTNVICDNGHNMHVGVYNGDQLVGEEVNEGGFVDGYNEQTLKTLGNITIPSAGNYTVKFTNSIQWTHLSLLSITFASVTPPTHNLSSAVNPSGKATVTLSATSVAEGGTATATYSSINAAYEFDYWSISGTGALLSSTTDNPTTITMGTTDATVTANLKEKTPVTDEVTAEWGYLRDAVKEPFPATANTPSTIDGNITITAKQAACTSNTSNFAKDCEYKTPCERITTGANDINITLREGLTMTELSISLMNTWSGAPDGVEISFYDESGGIIPDYTKLVSFNVPTDNQIVTPIDVPDGAKSAKISQKANVWNTWDIYYLKVTASSGSTSPQHRTITLDPNGGSFTTPEGWTLSEGKLTAEVYENADLTLPNCSIVSRSGYTADGWYTGTTDGDKYTTITYAQAENVSTLYPHWTETPPTPSGDAIVWDFTTNDFLKEGTWQNGAGNVNTAYATDGKTTLLYKSSGSGDKWQENQLQTNGKTSYSSNILNQAYFTLPSLSGTGILTITYGTTAGNMSLRNSTNSAIVVVASFTGSTSTSVSSDTITLDEDVTYYLTMEAKSYLKEIRWTPTAPPTLTTEWGWLGIVEKTPIPNNTSSTINGVTLTTREAYWNSGSPAGYNTTSSSTNNGKINHFVDINLLTDTIDITLESGMTLKSVTTSNMLANNLQIQFYSSAIPNTNAKLGDAEILTGNAQNSPQEFTISEAPKGALSAQIFRATTAAANTYFYYCKVEATATPPVTTYSITYNCDNADSDCPQDVASAISLPDPLPDAPIKTGYTFNGWYTNSDKTTLAVAGAPLTANTTLYAKWTKQIVPYTDDLWLVGSNFSWGWTLTSAPKMEKDDKGNYSWKGQINTNNDDGFKFVCQTGGFYPGFVAKKPQGGGNVNVNAGGTFDVLYTNSSDDDCKFMLTENSGIYTITLDLTDKDNGTMTITEVKTITFHSNYGSEVSPLHVVTGQKATQPATPTKNNNTFQGWFTDATLTQSYDWNSLVNDDIDLYAKWEYTGTVYYINGSNLGIADWNSGDWDPNMPKVPQMTKNDDHIEYTVPVAFKKGDDIRFALVPCNQKWNDNNSCWNNALKYPAFSADRSTGTIATYQEDNNTNRNIKINLTGDDNYSITMCYDGVNVYAVIEQTAPPCAAPTSVSVGPTSEAGNYGYRYSTGETIKLTATATGGNGTYSYQWQKLIGSDWTDISNATNADLQISNCSHQDGGSYRCVVSTGETCSKESDPYFVRIYTLDGNYYGSDFVKNPIVWTSEKVGVATVHLNESSTYLFKVTDNDGGSQKWYGSGAGNYIIQTGDNKDCGTGNSDIRLFTGPAGDYTFTVDITNAPDYVNVVTNYPEVTHPVQGYVYLTKWWDCYVHFWYNNDDVLTSWGSDPKINTYTTICGTDYWYFPVLDHYMNFIAKNNTKDATDGNTTGDQWTSDHSGKYITHDGSNWGWHDFATYSITFNGNGNTDGEMTNVTGICPGSSVTLAANAYTKTGYNFAGWATTSSGSKAYDDEAQFIVNNDLPLFALWTAKIYTVILDKQGGQDGSDNVQITYDTKTSTVTPPTKTGYDFQGYYAKTGGQGTKYFDKDGNAAETWDITEDNTTLFAHWTPIEYTIHYDNLNGTTKADETYTIESDDITLTAPTGTYAGYTFAGWYDGDGNKVETIAQGTTGDITLTANWTKELQTPEVTWADFADASLGELVTFTITTTSDADLTGDDVLTVENGTLKNKTIDGKTITAQVACPTTAGTVTVKFATDATATYKATETISKTISVKACETETTDLYNVTFTSVPTSGSEMDVTGGKCTVINCGTGSTINDHCYIKLSGDVGISSKSSGKSFSNAIICSVNEEIKVGDVISVKYICTNTNYDQPSKLYTNNLTTLTNVTTLAQPTDKNVETIGNYTVVANDGIAGQTSFVVGRGGSNNYINSVFISRKSTKYVSPDLTWVDEAPAKRPWADGGFTISAVSDESAGAITYSSTNTDVATVDATTGVVTLVGAGTTELKATIAIYGCFAEQVVSSTMEVTYPSCTAPTITTDPVGGTYEKDAKITLSVVAEKADPNDNLSYQWQSSVDNEEWANLTDDTNSDTYSPSSAAAGTLYYRCVVTASQDRHYSASANSNSAAITITAITITFDGNGDDVEGTTEAVYFQTGDDVTLPNNGFTLGCNIFAGWATTPTGVVMYADGEVIENIPATEDFTLYAKWNPSLEQHYSAVFNNIDKFDISYDVEKDIVTNGISIALSNASSDTKHKMTKPAIKGSSNSTIVTITVPADVTNGTISVSAATYNGGDATLAIAGETGNLTTQSLKGTIVNGDAAEWTAPTLETASCTITSGGTYYIKETSGTNNIYIYSFSVTASDGCTNAYEFIGTEDSDWSKLTNWQYRSGAISTLPTEDIQTNIKANVKVTDASAKAAKVVLYDNSKLEINSTAALQVAGTVKRSNGDPTTVNDIYIHSDATGTGALIFDNSNADRATMEYYSKASGAPNSCKWQWAATPFCDVNDVQYNYYGAWLSHWDNSTKGWGAMMKNGDGMTPFDGYCISRKEPGTFWMQGTLVSTEDRVQPLDYSGTTKRAGLNIIGNSWSAPINIHQWEVSDFVNAEATIVILNTGLDEQGTAGVGSEAGQYISIPVKASQLMSSTLQVIPAMQAFQVRATAADAKVVMNYDQLVRKSNGGIDIQPMRAPSRATNNDIDPAEVVTLRIDVKGARYNDFLYLFQHNQFTDAVDNGWDGEKMLGDVNAVQLYVLPQSGKLAVSAQPELVGTQFGFYKGEDETYTITFDYNGTDRLYLYDANTDTYTEIKNGNSYTFSSYTTSLERRFSLTDTNPYEQHPIVTGEDAIHGDMLPYKYIEEEHLKIRLNGQLYDGRGAMLNRVK
ncbi:MAG: InlB B-repeat-containing protein [Paludibacteraceae bacterium]|nr:InlB B-repeat-containing protein [Paludibacteraceae bacterium]